MFSASEGAVVVAAAVGIPRLLGGRVNAVAVEVAVAFVILLLLLRFARKDSDDGEAKRWRLRAPSRAVDEDDEDDVDDAARTRMRNLTLAATNGAEAILAAKGSRVPEPLAKELGAIIDIVLRDYVSAWYDGISADGAFVAALRATMAEVLGELGARLLARLNLVSFALDTAADALTLQLRAHGEARGEASKDEAAYDAGLLDNSHPVVAAANQRNAATLGRLRADGRLHPAFSWGEGAGGSTRRAAGALTPPEERYLRHVAGRLVTLLAPAEDRQCRAARHLLRELLASAVLAPVLAAVQPSNVVNWAYLGLRLLDRRKSQEPMAPGSPRSPRCAADDYDDEFAADAVSPGVAPAGFDANDGAWRWFAGALDSRRAKFRLSDCGEGAFLLRIEPRFYVARNSTDACEVVLTYNVDGGACDVVLYGAPSSGFEYGRFGGGARDARLVDRAAELAESPPFSRLDALLETHFRDVAFRGVVFDGGENGAPSPGTPRRPSDDGAPRRRTPMPHEAAFEAALVGESGETAFVQAKREAASLMALYHEQRRHVLLIDVQAAVEACEETAESIQVAFEDAELRWAADARGPARQLEKVFLSAKALDRATAKRFVKRDRDRLALSRAAWRDGDGAARVHRLVTALDAALAHGAARNAPVLTIDEDADRAPAAYCAYLLEPDVASAKMSAKVSRALHAEAKRASVRRGASSADDAALAPARRAAGVAWVVEALAERCLHGALFEALAHPRATREYYGPEAVLREPNDAARLLWFAQRIDDLKVEAPRETLREHETWLYTFCVHDEAWRNNAATAAPTAVVKHSNKPRDDDAEERKEPLLDDAASEAPAARRLDDAAARRADESPAEDLIEGSRRRRIRAEALCGASDSAWAAAAARVNFLLRARAPKQVVYAHLVPAKAPQPKQIATATVARVVVEDRHGAALDAAGSARRAKGLEATHYRVWFFSPQSAERRALANAKWSVSQGKLSVASVSEDNLAMGKKSAAGFAGGVAAAAAVPAGDSVGAAAGLAADERGAPVVVPLSTKNAYARRRYRDFRALRASLAAAVGEGKKALIPQLPPRRVAERLYNQSAAALEERRAGLEAFLTAVLLQPFLRDSHELRTFVGGAAPRRRPAAAADAASTMARFAHSVSGSALSSLGSFEGTPHERAPRLLDDDDDDDDDESSSDDEDDDFGRTTDELQYGGVSDGGVSPGLVELADGSADARARASASARVVGAPGKREPTAGDWLKLKRVEHRTYSLLRELFDVDRMGMMRRNFVSLLHQGARASMSPSLAVWLGDAAAPEQRCGLLTAATKWIANVVWPNGKARRPRPRAEEKTAAQHSAVAAELQTRLAATIPLSLASLVGTQAADDATAKLHELILCPVQLRSLTYTLLDLVLLEVCPELQLHVGGLDHLLS